MEKKDAPSCVHKLSTTLVFDCLFRCLHLKKEKKQIVAHHFCQLNNRNWHLTVTKEGGLIPKTYLMMLLIKLNQNQPFFPPGGMLMSHSCVTTWALFSLCQPWQDQFWPKTASSKNELDIFLLLKKPHLFFICFFLGKMTCFPTPPPVNQQQFCFALTCKLQQ